MTGAPEDVYDNIVPGVVLGPGKLQSSAPIDQHVPLQLGPAALNGTVPLTLLRRPPPHHLFGLGPTLLGELLFVVAALGGQHHHDQDDDADHFHGRSLSPLP